MTSPASLATVSRREAARELLARRAARSNILDFTRYTYPGVEGKSYDAQWYHELLCEYLDRFVAGDIRRLIVCMPPRHGKSQLVSRSLPAFILGKKPRASIIAASYSADLSSRMNRDVQRIIDSPAYRQLFPESVLFGKNIRTVSGGTWLRNNDIFEIVDQGGVYRSAGVGGGITGMGFDYGIIDDPFKDRRDANSPTIRQSVWDWYTSTFYTRQSRDAGILITVTRWHLDDLVGRLKDLQRGDNTDNWHIIELPARAEAPIAHYDPRKVGEPLWPARFTDEFLRTVEANNVVDWASLYQQKPIATGQELFDTAKINVIDNAPDCKQVVRFYDLAVTAKSTSDYTVGIKLGVTQDERPVILDMYRVQATLPQVHDGIAQNAAIDGVEVPIILEGEKAGIVQLDYLIRDPRMNRHSIRTQTPQGDKFTRAAPFATRVNNGVVDMVRGSWNHALLDELAVFPQGKHDDIVDALSGAWHGVNNTMPFFALY